MGKIIVSEFVSLDGVIEGPGDMDSFKYAGWTMSYSDAESMQFKLNETLSSGSLLLGRVTYEGFAAAWPTIKDPAGFADKMNSMPKYVVSATLSDPSWNNTRIISSDFVNEIIALKQKEEKDILVAGSSRLVDLLLQNQLVDELRILLYPTVLGAGKKLFKEDTKFDLHLVDSKTFETGVVLLTYSLVN
jgi:dihydrofolate reductase